MNPREALQLVRAKFVEEQKGVTNGEVADRYRRACEDYPAQMKTAHLVWASELAKTLP